MGYYLRVTFVQNVGDTPYTKIPRHVAVKVATRT